MSPKPALVAFGLAIGGPILLLGVAMVVTGGQTYRTARRIDASGQDAVTDAVEGGRVDLEGTATEHEATLQAPFTGRSCLGYEYVVERYSSGGDAGDSNWSSYLTGEDAVPFRLETDSGTVLVRPEGATVDVADGKRQFASDAGEEPRPGVENFFTSDEYDRTRNFGLGAYVHDPLDSEDRQRYTETVLEDGETTFVSGIAVPPSEAGHLPRGVDAAVCVPGDGGDGPLDWLSSPTAVVADRSMDETVEDLGTSAFKRIVGGAFLAGVGAIVLWAVLLG